MSVSLIDGHIDNDVQEMTFEDVKRIRENSTAECCDIKELHELIDTAIEKQIPKKPVRKEFGKYCCSVCGNSLLLSSTKLCSECSQAVDWNVVFMCEDECRELVLKKYPEYTIGRITDYGDWYEVLAWKPKSWSDRIFSVQKNNGYMREIGV